MSDETAERVAVDTTVIVSAFIGRGVPTQVVRRWQAGLFVLVVTSAIIAEYADVLSRTQIRVRYGLDPEDVTAFLEDIRNRAELVTPLAESELPLRARDPKDDLFLACALAGVAGTWSPVIAICSTSTAASPWGHCASSPPPVCR